MLKKITVALALLTTVPAQAAVTTITFLDGSSGSHNGAFALDASSNAYALSVLCGATTTTLGATVADCAIINASGQLNITGPVTNAGTFAVQLNATPSLANGNGEVPTQGGAVLSATNGGFENILQGNAVLSLTNPSFASITDGTTKATVNAGDSGLTVHVGGGSIANTTFAATQATASNLNATVVGAGSAGTATGGVVTVQGVASMTPILANPGTATSWGLFADNAAWTAGTSVGATAGCEFTSGGATALTTGHTGTPGCTSARGLLSDKSSVSGTALGAVVSNLGTLASGTPAAENVNAFIVGGAGSGGTAGADAAAWTAGTTSQTPIGCEFTSGGATAIVTAHMGTVGCTAARAAFTDKSSVGGTALSAATSAYGTAPTGTVVEGVNAFVTNTNANGQTTMSASSPVVIASNQSAVPVSAASGAFASGSISSGALASGSIASGAIAAGASAGDPCMYGTKTNLPISTNATALTQIIALSGSTKIYICSISLIAPGATAFNLVGGTGTNCAASAAAILGSTTAANGLSFAANGGMTLGNGSGVIALGAAGSELCTLQSNAVQVAGNLTYVQQ